MRAAGAGRLLAEDDVYGPDCTAKASTRHRLLAQQSFVVWYCKSQAARFGRQGARILSVSPGSIDTAMGRLEEQSGAGAMLDHAALRRFGKPEEIAELLAFCASEKASYLTGIDILCDGGVVSTMTLRDKLAVGRSN
jgi:NAD(P)-dependent dehydrogenase (short-subunit alcohol dehydrogenase family)